MTKLIEALWSGLEFLWGMAIIGTIIVALLTLIIVIVVLWIAIIFIPILFWLF